MQVASDILGADASVIAGLVQSREVSPVEVVTMTLEAIARLDPLLNAFCTLAPDAAITAARALEDRILAGEVVGPLAGVPVGVKDLIFTKGMRTTFGSRLYADFIPEYDDIAVERLTAADAIVIGKTNACEFGLGGFGHNPLFPTTRNPWNRELTPGGSSAGSAAAVAAGLCPLALGSDGGGSVRLPAAFTGTVGIKPTMGRIPLWPGCRDVQWPGASGWESLEHLGPLTRSVDDAALMLDVVCGPDLRDRHSLPDEGVEWRGAPRRPLPPSLRVAFCPTWGEIRVDPEVGRIVAAAARRFELDLGCFVEERTAPLDDLIETARALVALETDLTGLRRLAEGRESDLSPGVRTLLRFAWKAEDFTDAVTVRKQAVGAMTRFMQEFDLIISPSVPTTPFAIDRNGPGWIDGAAVDDDAWNPALYPANLTGQPAISIPAGWTKGGLPVGLQIMGRRLQDALVISVAAAFERVQPWAGRRPPVSVWQDQAPPTDFINQSSARLSSRKKRTWVDI
jgi:aspartyl-tRNA(Asn)/glutamyl-tRNA(Gln) amidotransferase subunit A